MTKPTGLRSASAPTSSPISAAEAAHNTPIEALHHAIGLWVQGAPGGLLTVELARGLHQCSVVINPAWTRLEFRRNRDQRDTLLLCCSQTRSRWTSR